MTIDHKQLSASLLAIAEENEANLTHTEERDLRVAAAVIGWLGKAKPSAPPKPAPVAPAGDHPKLVWKFNMTSPKIEWVAEGINGKTYVVSEAALGYSFNDTLNASLDDAQATAQAAYEHDLRTSSPFAKTLRTLNDIDIKYEVRSVDQLKFIRASGHNVLVETESGSRCWIHQEKLIVVSGKEPTWSTQKS